MKETRKGINRNAIVYRAGYKFANGMIFRAYDDTKKTRLNKHLYVQCPYCGDVVSLASNSAKKLKSCGCEKMHHKSKYTVEFKKGWIYDGDAGLDSHNHQLVTVHSKWDEADTATFRLCNLKGGTVRWAHSAADEGVDEEFEEMFAKQRLVDLQNAKKTAYSKGLSDIKNVQKLYSKDEAFTFKCLPKEYKGYLLDNTTYAANNGEICHNNKRLWNNEPHLADFQLKIGDLRIFIENNGIIHEEAIHGIKTLLERQDRDRRTAEFCKKHGFAQIVVSYKMIEDRDEKAYRAYLRKAIKDAIKAHKAKSKA